MVLKAFEKFSIFLNNQPKKRERSIYCFCELGQWKTQISDRAWVTKAPSTGLSSEPILGAVTSHNKMNKEEHLIFGWYLQNLCVTYSLMLDTRTPIMIPRYTRVLCPNCRHWIATTAEDIRDGMAFEPRLFNWREHVYEFGEPLECWECQTIWISEDYGIYLETGWFPSRH